MHAYMYVHVVYMYVYSDKDNDAGEKIVDTVVTMFPTVTEFLGQSVQICPIQRYRAPENPIRLLELKIFQYSNSEKDSDFDVSSEAHNSFGHVVVTDYGKDKIYMLDSDG